MITVDTTIQQLSTEGIESILSEYNHVRLETIESREELEQVAQHNVNDGLIDLIEFIVSLSGE